MLHTKFKRRLERIKYRVDEWDKDFFAFVNRLKEQKDIILCGDLNLSHNRIDIFEAKRYENHPGYTKIERDSFTKFLNMGYIDTFRKLHPILKKYSFFTKKFPQRKIDNLGWRPDYFITNEESKNGIEIVESNILDKDLYNASDHIPIILQIKIS